MAVQEYNKLADNWQDSTFFACILYCFLVSGINFILLDKRIQEVAA
jgi:hypothetical protein